VHAVKQKELIKMFNIPKNMKDFESARPWWRTEFPTEIHIAEDGVSKLLGMIEDRERKPFFVLDEVLSDQPEFKKLFAMPDKYLFNATESEPKTGDVDKLVALIKEKHSHIDLMVGVGGGGTMDLSKAVGICLANPKSAEEYQGYGLDMVKGKDIWVMPTLCGTGAEVTPIAVLRGPKRKLGINNPYTEASVAVISPPLSKGVKKFNRVFTMLDCFFHHYEITKSKTSASDAVADSVDGHRIAREVLLEGVTEYKPHLAIKSAMASVLGGSSSIGGRVGAAHAISYGLSNSAPKLPHSVAVTISMLALEDLYKDGGYDDTLKILEINGLDIPKAKDYGINEGHIEAMTKTALGMEKLWHSHFGDGWEKKADTPFIRDIYERIVKA
jgi:3-deoxy-alpha-D-manno-octulosonate 8-oxidase